jgi:capsular polysaccharide biosynthesis protein
VLAAQAAANDVMSVLEPAYRPMHPSKGGRGTAAIVGLGVSLFLALLYMTARVAFNDTLIDAADVEALHLIPVLGVVPKLAPPHKKKARHKKGGARGAV